MCNPRSKLEQIFGHPGTPRDRRGLVSVALLAFSGAAFFALVFVFHVQGPLGGMVAAGSISALAASYLAAWREVWIRVQCHLLGSTWGDGRRLIVAFLTISMFLLGPILAGALVGVLRASKP